MAKEPKSASGRMFAAVAQFFQRLSDIDERGGIDPDWGIERLELIQDLHVRNKIKSVKNESLDEAATRLATRLSLISEIRSISRQLKNIHGIESITDRNWIANVDPMTYSLLMNIMRIIKELSENIDVSEADLTQFILERTPNPDIKRRLVKGSSGPREFSRDPLHAERTIRRLVDKFGSAAKEFAELPEGSRERLLAGYTVITSYEALKKRGYNVDTLPERDKVTEARRVKQAHMRAVSKPAA